MSGRLLSLNVGVPREVEWQGKTVRTAIWKEPVEGARMVRRINIDGDDQADREAHGGEHRAVYVYQVESYRYWERELGRDDFVMGQFGENFTVDGLADDEVCIGDRYRIGGAVFEVTQPRVTCYRLGIRMDNPSMPQQLVAHHRPGFYLRVIEEGMVAAGDAIEKVADGPEGLTVADIDGLLYLPNRSRPMLERAVRIPALSEGWRESFRSLLAQPVRAEPAWPGFRALRVAEVRPESSLVTSFLLVPDEPGAAPVPAGQYLTLRVSPDADAGASAAPLIRSYSLSDLVGERGYRISVRRDGVASRWLHEHLRAGDRVDAAAPRGDFVLRPGTRPVVLVSAGVGATPVLAMLHELARDHDDRPVWWLHGARNRAEHAFADEADALLAELPDSHRLVAYSQPRGDDGDGRGPDIVGRLDGPALDTADVPVDADYYVCGPTGFMTAMGAALTARGVDPSRVVTETFGAIAVHASGIVGAGRRAPHQPDGPTGTGPTVNFSRSGLSVAWDDRFPSLLDFAEACDVPVGFGCRQGVCHNCESGVLAGDVTWEIEPLEQPPEDRILACCTRPATELTLDL